MRRVNLSWSTRGSSSFILIHTLRAMFLSTIIRVETVPTFAPFPPFVSSISSPLPNTQFRQRHCAANVAFSLFSSRYQRFRHKYSNGFPKSRCFCLSFKINFFFNPVLRLPKPPALHENTNYVRSETSLGSGTARTLFG